MICDYIVAVQVFLVWNKSGISEIMMNRILVSGRFGRVLIGALLFIYLGLAGCTSFTKASFKNRGLRRAVEKDKRFTVQEAPFGAPAQRVASFHIAEKGWQALKKGRWQEAEDLFEKALSLDQRNPFCYFYLAEIRLQEGKPRQALILLKQAEVLFQDHPYWLSEVFEKKGLCLEKLNFPERARAAYDHARQHNPWNK